MCPTGDQVNYARFRKYRVVLIACALFAVVTISALPQGRVKFLTVNVWSGLTYKGTFRSGMYESKDQRAFRYGLLVNELREIDPDVIALNEANMLPGYAKRISRDLGYDFIYAVARGGVRLGQVGFPINLREGEVILAKRYLNLTLLGSKGLLGGYAGNFASFHLKEATRILAGKITVGEREVVVFNTMWHDSLSPSRLNEQITLYDSREIEGAELLARVENAVQGREIRLEEAQKTVQFINDVTGVGESAAQTEPPGSVAEEPVIVMMGDFNALSDSDEILLLKKAGLIDSWDGSEVPGHTWDESTNTNILKFFAETDGSPSPYRERSNYIFYRGDAVRVASLGLVLNDTTYDTHPSDHFGVLVELEF